jgi:hypothetical protein
MLCEVRDLLRVLRYGEQQRAAARHRAQAEAADAAPAAGSNPAGSARLVASRPPPPPPQQQQQQHQHAPSQPPPPQQQVPACAMPADTRSAWAAAASPASTSAFGAVRGWLTERLVGVACEGALHGGRARLRTVALHRLRGEAELCHSGRGARARPRAVFDLSFELEFEAALVFDAASGPACHRGHLVFTEVASHNEVDEYELCIRFSSRPQEGSAEEAVLLGLVGPLRAATARAADACLTRCLWERLAALDEALAAVAAAAATDT